MRCEKAERWISDDLDGALSAGRKKRKLEAHLTSCPGCRSYRERSVRLAGIVVQAPVRTEDEKRAFLARLDVRIRALKAGAASGKDRTRQAPAFFPGSRWAWAGAASLLVLAAGLYLVLAPGGPVGTIFQAAPEETWASLERQLETSPDLVRDIDASLRASLDEPLRDMSAEVIPLIIEHDLFLEGLSDEDAELLAAEIALQIEI
jgi:hypothetical protein